MAETVFTSADEKQLDERGVPLDDARRQLSHLLQPEHYLELVRPCTPSDGIKCLGKDELGNLQALHADAAKAGRFVKFIPASGAASRMFASLAYFAQGAGRELSWDEVAKQAEEGRREAGELVAFFEGLKRFAFHQDLQEVLGRRDQQLNELAEARSFLPVLDALLGSAGLDYAHRAKGLVKFHRYPEGGRTAFEEHLIEAAHYARDEQGQCRVHFTVLDEHRAGFAELARLVAPRYEKLYDVRYRIGYSTQKPSTDTLALDGDGRPVRDAQGRLAFRPGGHGALIENLNDLQADVVFVKNIDNVQPDRLRQATAEWKPALAGHLLQLQQKVFDYLGRLRGPEPPGAIVEEAARFAREQLRVDVGPDGAASPASLIEKLDRPLRVCGVVPNTGEPGGGPFWVRRRDGSIGPQIVETAQIDPASEDQQAILRSSTHFNPVDLVCAVRDSAGRPFDLRSFVDPDAVIVTSKPELGRELRVLERPGLWNGGMAGWITVFVEVPLETFSPVKTVIDLLRDEHQPD